jgi:pimeloyl-ACP methyl ester carboxylesterase
MAYIYSIIFSLFGFTYDPMKQARKDIEGFKKNYQDQIKSYQGIYRLMSYAEAGDPNKRPVLFVHGSPGSKEAWYSYLQDEDLLKNFHLLSVDRPGYGESESGITELSVKKQAEDIWELVKIISNKEKPILVGHSYGGAVIARMAMDHPEEVDGLLFVASSLDPSQEKTKLIQYLGEIWGIRSLIPDYLRVCNREIKALKLSLDELIWSSISANIRIIHGDKDELVPVQNVEFLKSNVPHTQIKNISVLSGVNHFVPWNKPEVIKQNLLDWNS